MSDVMAGHEGGSSTCLATTLKPPHFPFSLSPEATLLGGMPHVPAAEGLPLWTLLQAQPDLLRRPQAPRSLLCPLLGSVLFSAHDVHPVPYHYLGPSTGSI